MRDKGYKLPAVIDPGAYRCVKVYLPDDLLYYAAFWNAFEFFAKHIAWERDDEKRGKDAAAVWRVAYEMSREEWLTGACEMPFDLKINPSNKCQMLASTDGGETWHLALDLSCAGTGPVIKPPPVSDGGYDVFITAYINNWLILHQDILFVFGGTKEEYITNIINNIFDGYEPPPGVRGVLGRIYDVGYGLDTESEGAFDECTYVPFYEDFRDFITDDPINWFNNLSDWLINWLNETSLTLMELLNELAAAMGAEKLKTFIESYGGGGGGGGFGDTCEIVDLCEWFPTDQYDWTRVSPWGTWVGGTGWLVGDNAAEPYGYQVEIENHNIPVGHIDHLKVDWEPHDNGNALYVYVDGEETVANINGPVGYRSINIPVDGTVHHIRVLMYDNNAAGRVLQVCYYSEA